ncbi:unnamed protein product [Adineta steineri]|uniref:Uncharacterized protein n=1 Tax=Adineta steineri TaxID=433720 RepID=A0A813TI01_9BILA|nr:unnamed protein product [Adineta steineri]CAF4149260.1 unnamed protein product [Adineta steineri]
MSTDLKYEIAVNECNSLRRQLKDAYNKCTAIFDALSILDEHSTKERIILEKLICDLRQTLENELEKNIELSIEKLHIEKKEKYLKRELNDTKQDLNKITIRYRRIYVKQQQEKFIQENLTCKLKK